MAIRSCFSLAVSRLQQREDDIRLLHIALEHARLYRSEIGRGVPTRFLPMRKHLSWYVRNLPSAANLRRELIETSSAAEVATVLNRYFAYRQRWEQFGAAE